MCIQTRKVNLIGVIHRLFECEADADREPRALQCAKISDDGGELYQFYHNPFRPRRGNNLSLNAELARAIASDFDDLAEPHRSEHPIQRDLSEYSCSQTSLVRERVEIRRLLVVDFSPFYRHSTEIS